MKKKLRKAGVEKEATSYRLSEDYLERFGPKLK